MTDTEPNRQLRGRDCQPAERGADPELNRQLAAGAASQPGQAPMTDAELNRQPDRPGVGPVLNCLRRQLAERGRGTDDRS
jgi:hypothetical protein